MSTYDIPAPIKPQLWQKDALCAQVDPELWFPDDSAPHSSQPTQDAITQGRTRTMNAHPPRVGDVITTAEQLDALWHLEEVLIDASSHYPSGGTFDRCWTRPVPASVGGIYGMWEVLVYGASMPDSLTTTERIRIATVLYLPGAETLTEAAVRSQIAADIREALPEVGMGVLVTERRMALRDGMERAARITEGGAR